MEDILTKTLRNLYASADLPDNPFTMLNSTINFFKISRDIEDARVALEKTPEKNKVVEEGDYGIGSVVNLYNAYGTKNVLELLHTHSVASLIKTLVPFTQETNQKLGDMTLQVNYSISGGYLFRSPTFDVPEAATIPLRLYAVF